MLPLSVQKVHSLVLVCLARTMHPACMCMQKNIYKREHWLHLMAYGTCRLYQNVGFAFACNENEKKRGKKNPVTISPHIGPTKRGGQLRQSRCQIKMSSLWTTRRSPLICQQRWIELFPVSAPKPTDQPLFRSMAVACPCSGLICRLTYWPTDELADGRTQRNAPAGGRTEVLLAGRLS